MLSGTIEHKHLNRYENLKDQLSESKHKTCTVFKALQKLDLLQTSSFYLHISCGMLLGYREWAIIPLMTAVAVSFFLGRPHMFVVFSAMLAAAIFWNRLARLCSAFSKNRIRRLAGAKIAISDLHPDTLVLAFKPILRTRLLQRLEDMVEERIKRHILRSGTAENPRVLGIKSVLYPMIGLIITVPAAIITTVVYDSVTIAPALFVPVLFLSLLYFIILRFKADERRIGVENEIAPFATLASIMESVNVSLFSTLSMITKSPSDIFPMIRKEGRRVQNITCLGRSPIAALMELADSHPSIVFRNFLEGYISSFNTGGTDTSAYLQEQSRRFFGFMQMRMTRYAKQADMIAQLILTLMLLLPMMGLSMVFFATGSIAETVMLMMIATFPFITIILIIMVHSSQPKRMDSIHTSWIVFVVGLAVVGVVYVLRDQVWEAVGAGITAGSFLNMAFVRKSLADSASAESQLPEFTRQMARLKNIGIDIMNGIRQMRQEISYMQGSKRSATKFGKTFDEIIDRLYRTMVAGSSFDQAISKIPIPSWNTRLVFFILGKVHESGGGTAKTLDDIARWVTEYEDARKEMMANLRASLMTAFVGPVLMVMILSISNQLTDKFAEISEVSADLGVLSFGMSQPDITGLSEILTIVATACMAVTLSKINYFTVRNTMFVGIITSVTMILLYVVPTLDIFKL